MNDDRKPAWNPTAKFRYRTLLANSLLRDVRFKTFLEVGFGNGDFLLRLAEGNVSCGVGIDLSYEAVQHAADEIERRNLADVLVVHQGDFGELETNPKAFDLAVAFEVIEHIEDDVGALRSLRDLINPEGHLLASVPAHMSLWGPKDVAAGHMRRYEREELIAKVTECGFHVQRLLSYGFPVMNVLRGVKHLLSRSEAAAEGNALERTARSGTYQNRAFSAAAVLTPLYFRTAYWLGRPFLNGDRGEGYLFLAKRA